MYDLVIKGNLILSDRILSNGLLLISKEKIVGITDFEKEPPNTKEFIDASGKWVFPGGVDAHVHSYNPVGGRDEFIRSTKSAAAGGITTIIDMPLDSPLALTNVELLQEKIAKVKSEAVVDVALLATLRKQGGASDVAPLAKNGVCGFKLGTFETDPNRFPRIPDDQLYEIFPEVKKTGLVVGFHAENNEIVNYLIEKLKNRSYSAIMHCKSRPPICESLEVLKLLEFAHEFGTKLHIYHLTVPRVFRFIEKFKEEGVNVSAETCIHYLVLNESDMERLGGFGKINPPLRSVEFQRDLWNLLISGKIDFVSSDHAPYTRKVKESPNIFENKSGAPGVETLFPLTYSEGVVKRGLDIILFTKLIAENPARRFRLYPKKGVIAVGSDADITIFDPKENWVIDGTKTYSIANWSPYDGTKVNGRVIQTIVRGHIVYNGKEVIGSPGLGKFVPALKEDSV